MVVAGTLSAETLDILQPAILHPDMLSEVRPNYNLKPGCCRAVYSNDDD